MKKQYTSNEVMALTGITGRQLQWWDEQGVVRPQRSGRNRAYSLDDVAELSVICELRERGFSLQRVRKILRFLQRELGEKRISTLGQGGEFHLLTDGKRIYLEDSAHRIVDILRNARQAIFSVCLTDAVRRVQSSARALKKGSATVRTSSGRRRMA